MIRKTSPLVILLVGIITFSSAFALQAYAFSTTGAAAFSGFAWSDTTGWLDMNSVAIDSTTGNISGYAWSDNIGWVSFNTSDVGSCPQAPCQAKLTATGLQGFAKALSGGTAQSGGWDGYISFNDPSIARTSATAFSGYAWGSDVVGWLSLSGVTTTTTPVCPNGANNYPTCTTCTAPQVMVAGVCTGSTAGACDPLTNGKSLSTQPTANLCTSGTSSAVTTYPSCSSTAGYPGSCSAGPFPSTKICNDNVFNPSNYSYIDEASCSDYSSGSAPSDCYDTTSVTCTTSSSVTQWGWSCTGTTTTSCSAGLGSATACSGAANSVSWSGGGTTCGNDGAYGPITIGGNIQVSSSDNPGTGSVTLTCNSDGTVTQSGATCSIAPPPPPDITISTDKTRVHSGNPVTVSWTIAGTGTCTITKNGATPAWGTNITASGSHSGDVVTTQTAYKMSCNGGVTAQAIVNILAIFNEF